MRLVQTGTRFETHRREAPLLLGNCPAIGSLRGEIEAAARSDAKVLVSGETGVGKEVVAELIHAASARRHSPFVAINCAGLPDALLESELFGHVRGSFTGAYRDKSGLAERADKGTLFLDELAEMSPRMQGVLLRFLETGEIHAVGSDRLEYCVDTRLIAATNKSLPDLIASGQFREDLYYRLNVIPIRIPPLRERGQDILVLFRHFLEHFSRENGRDTPTLSPIVEDLLLHHRWPGNVRELKNAAERIAVRDHDGHIRPNMLPPELLPAPASSLCKPAAATQTSVVSHPAANAAWNDMMFKGESFWKVVHPRFIDRELTKADVREMVRRGLEETAGSYKKLTELFNMPEADYKRFLAFLNQHDCHLDFTPFREKTP